MNYYSVVRYDYVKLLDNEFINKSHEVINDVAHVQFPLPATFFFIMLLKTLRLVLTIGEISGKRTHATSQWKLFLL